jgi:hypothetical protein
VSDRKPLTHVDAYNVEQYEGADLKKTVITTPVVKVVTWADYSPVPCRSTSFFGKKWHLFCEYLHFISEVEKPQNMSFLARANRWISRPQEHLRKQQQFTIVEPRKNADLSKEGN